MVNISPVILCGGSGSRLWPVSREAFPKQFHIFSGVTSLFQQAVIRCNDLSCEDIKVNNTLIVTNEEHRFLALDQLRELPKISATLLLEPESKNTAPALTFAAIVASDKGEDPILVVTPADHTFEDIDAFNNVLRNAIRVAESGSIVILGIPPSKPETGFGYIKRDEEAGLFKEFKVSQFTEKPDLETAKKYLASEKYSWNSGVLIVRASVWLEVINFFRRDIFEATSQAFKQRIEDYEFIRPDSKLFESIPNESIDYAVIEKCPGSDFKIRMLMLNAGWSDLGSWDAVSQGSNRDLLGNTSFGDVIFEGARDTFAFASHRLLCVVGVSNLAIIETADAVLIIDKSQSQHVKKIVSKLKDTNRSEAFMHRKVFRPWGWYDVIDEGSKFKVKRIQININASLSLQSHKERSEHWVVVRGVAEVTCGSNITTLHENQSTFIPQGTIHRLANIGSEVLEIIEVQSGTYLGEDDILRIDDPYRRV
jgi:mannose-1-phosphate guanylyltransferase/mannose-6-phosphate isomerase